MIKYVEFDSFDETGQHIIPVNTLYDLNKTASGTYSPEIMKVVSSIQRNPKRYYVVINALGSYEVWGCNRNGDDFPEEGLTHISLRTDMGTPNDYGYKTFEYYAKWFKNHVNKPNSPSFGEVVFSHWNPVLHRIELIVAIDVDKDAKTIAKLENGELVSVSMGTKVPFDVCRICGNKAKTRKEYCLHAREYLGEIVTEELARKWSAQLGKTILPGIQVSVMNLRPRFFDISDVFIGADRTAYVLGKAASKHAISSLNIAEAYGITDDMIDKVSTVKKLGDIDKQVGGALGPSDIDGTVQPIDPKTIFSKAVNEKINDTIVAEPMLPRDFLDGIAKTRSLPSIFSTMLGLGMFPKPVEVQRIVLVHIGEKPLADQLENNNQIFDQNNSDQIDVPNSFDDSLSRILIPFLAERSACPHFMIPRMEYIDKQSSLDKYAFYSSTMGNDYWLDPNPKIGFQQQPMISPSAGFLAGIAALYTGLKAKASGIKAENMANIFVNKPWLAALIGGGIVYSIYKAIMKNDNPLLPSSGYENALQDTNFTGHIKGGSFKGNVKSGIITAGIAFPAAYFANAINQRSMAKKGVPAFNVGYLDPPVTSVVSGLSAGSLAAVSEKILSKLKMLKK